MRAIYNSFLLKFLPQKEPNETGIYCNKKCFLKAMLSTNPNRFSLEVYGCM